VRTEFTRSLAIPFAEEAPCRGRSANSKDDLHQLGDHGRRRAVSAFLAGLPRVRAVRARSTLGLGARVEGGEPAMSEQRLAIGVMGTSGGALSDEVRERACRLGRAIAEQGAVLITGACPGLPYEAVRGAKAAGGLVVGISPGLSIDEHRSKYGSPVDGFDVLIYTGSGLMGREITNIRSCDIVVIVGGRTGTLGELAIAYDEGRQLVSSPARAESRPLFRRLSR
jgi:uncharacterized protein (TIGR00725 family)